MLSSEYLCPRCFSGNVHQYEQWIKQFAELAVIHNNREISMELWALNHCSKCGDQFQSILEKSQFGSSAPYVLEWITMEEVRLLNYKNGDMKFENVEKISDDDYRVHNRSGLLLDIGVWVALSITSGVLGNFAYDVIKQAVVVVKSQIQQSANNRTHFNNSDLKEFQSLFMEWDDLSDEDLEQLLSILYEYSKIRLGDVSIRKLK